MSMSDIYMFVGFCLAAYSIVANDAIQTLGPFLSSNEHRPWWLLWAYACAILLAVFIYGYVANYGDVTYGRLAKFPMPATGFTWLHIIPPIFILILTKFGVPVSTTFLILTVFVPGNIGAVLQKSVLGYVLAIVVAVIIYFVVTKPIERKFIESKEEKIPKYWVVLQWVSTGFLWSQWLIQDLANIFIYMPRHLSLHLLFFAVVVLLTLHAVLFYFRGGSIQGIVTSKTNTQDVRSATIINFLFGAMLLFFKEYSKMPMSTTFVFLGLLAGRELALTIHIHHRQLVETGKMVFKDIFKACIGLAVSVALALTLPSVYTFVENMDEEPAASAAMEQKDQTQTADVATSETAKRGNTAK